MPRPQKAPNNRTALACALRNLSDALNARGELRDGVFLRMLSQHTNTYTNRCNDCPASPAVGSSNSDIHAAELAAPAIVATFRVGHFGCRLIPVRGVPEEELNGKATET